MVSFTVRMRFEQTDREGVAEMLRRLGLASRREPGCIHYVAHFVEGEPATVLIYEQYEDEGALDYHRNTPHFKQFATNGLYRMKHEREIEHLSAVG